MKKNVSTVSFFIAITFLLIVSCMTIIAKENVFTFARNEAIEILDPYNHFKCSNSIMEYLIYDRLWDNNPEARLATEISVSPDAREYTLTLRQGVKFHNGEPFNAESVKVSLERFKNEELVNSTYWTTLEEIEIIDDYKVIIKFSESNVAFFGNPYLSVTAMLPPKAFKEQGTELFKHPIGTGAFTFESFIPERDLVVNKNPDYWGEPAYVDKFIYLNIPEDSTRIAALNTGEVDLADSIPVDQIPLIDSNPNLEVFRVPAWASVVLCMKCDIEPFTDIKFRQAVNLAIDREGIVQYVTKSGNPCKGVLLEGQIGYDPDSPPIERDIEKAKQLVKESTYDGRDIVILARLGLVPKNLEVLQAIQAQLIEAGINAKLEILEAGTYTEKRNAGNYDLFFTYGVYTEDMTQFLIYRIVNNHTLHIGYENKELFDLILKQVGEVDEEKRSEMFKEINKTLNDDVAPWLYLYQLEQIFAKRKDVTGGIYYFNSTPDLRHVRYEK